MSEEPGDDPDGSADGNGRTRKRERQPRLADQRDVPDVYPPAEDSDLLARTIVPTVESGDRALDVGTGTGYVAAAMAEAGADVVGVDLNPRACSTAAANGVAVVRADLVAPFADRTFDVVACNPPYLPTAPEREWDDWMERALSGGPDGRAVVDPFVESIGRVLAPDGDAYLLISTLTGVEDVIDDAAGHGFEVSEIAGEDHPYERLVVLLLRPQ